jgi:hypothetical protein
MSPAEGLAQRPIGNTGLHASVLGFGTGDNAGLMVLGSVADQREAVAQAMSNLKDSELSRAQEVWRKKFGSPATDPQTRAKHMRFLITRGFNAEVVRRVVKGDGLVDDPSD